MGKDATNTLFAENQAVDQRLGSDISGQQFKGEQSSELLKQAGQPAGGFHGDKWHEHEGDQLKSANPSQLKDDTNAGFHGDKWKEFSGQQSKDEQLNGRRPSLTNSMGDEFPADQFQKEQFDNQLKTETVLRPQHWSDLPPTHTATTFSADVAQSQMNAAPMMEDHLNRDIHFGQDSGVKGDIIKNDTREVKQEMLAELKSHAGHSDHVVPSEIHEGTTIHDGRLHDGMMRDGRTVTPQMAISQDMLSDGTMRDATIHDGRTRTIHDSAPVMEPNPLDKLPLADRIIAGVHAGDPLSFGNPLKDAGKKSKKDKKLKNKKGEQTFGADEHFKNDKDLIPHEHLKKDESVLADANLSGGAVLQKEDSFKASQPIIESDSHLKSSLKKDKKDKKNKLKKEKHFDNDAHLNKNVNIVEDMQLNRDAALSKDLYRDDPLVVRDANINRDSELSKDFKDSQFKDSQFKDSQFKDSQFKDSQFQDSQFKNSSSQDAYLVTDDRLNKDLNKDANFVAEDAAGKKGLKDKVRSKKEKLKQKMGMKKDEHIKDGESQPIEGSIPTKGHEIATIKIPGIESGDRAAQEMVNHQAKAKKELNAELKEHAGHSDHIAPSEILGGMGQMSLHENRAVDTQIMPNKGGAMADQITRDQVLAKSELNAEIKGHAGSSLMPSELSGNQFQKDAQFQNRDLLQENHFQSNDFQNKDLLQSNQFQNRDMQSNQFQNEFQNKDLFQSNQFQNKDLLQSNQFQNNDLLQSNQFQNKDFQSKDFQSKDFQSDFQQSNLKQFEGDKFEGLGATNNTMNKDNILAKNDLNAEIKGLGKDHIMPSEISHKQGNEFQQFQHGKLEGEKLAGFSGSNDSLMNNNLLAKKEVLAEIKEAGMGHKDSILPSELIGNSQFQSQDHLNKDFQKDFHKDQLDNQFQNLQGKAEFENTAEFQNKQFENNNEYLNDKPGGLGAMFKDEVMRDHIQAKKELNAEIKEVAIGHSDQLLPSEISGAVPAGGVTVIHDGRDMQGSDRLKGEMDYELAKESIDASEQPMSFSQKIAATVASAAVAVKETLQNLH